MTFPITSQCSKLLNPESSLPAGHMLQQKRTPISVLVRRGKKMRRHKRLKRWKRDAAKYAKYHRKKKVKSEQIFHQKMLLILSELASFDAETYVRETIKSTKTARQSVERGRMEGYAFSGSKLHPHWSTLMSIEELYGLPESDYIDKQAGYPDEEDLAEMQNLKIDYYRKFKGIEEVQRSDDSDDSHKI